VPEHSSEERLRLALDAGKCGVWDWEIPENRITWTDRLYEIHGSRRSPGWNRMRPCARTCAKRWP